MSRGQRLFWVCLFIVAVPLTLAAFAIFGAIAAYFALAVLEVAFGLTELPLQLFLGAGAAAGLIYALSVKMSQLYCECLAITWRLEHEHSRKETVPC